MTALIVLQNFGISLAVGASTFALIFYFRALEDGTIDSSEKRFMHTVYFVLRLGMVIIVLTELLFLLLALGGDTTALFSKDSFWFKWTLLAIIIVNAVLMQMRKMPMWLGPALAGGSWYMYFFVHNLSDLTVSYLWWFAYYVLFIFALVIFLKALRRVYIEKKSLL